MKYSLSEVVTAMDEQGRVLIYERPGLDDYGRRQKPTLLKTVTFEELKRIGVETYSDLHNITHAVLSGLLVGYATTITEIKTRYRMSGDKLVRDPGAAIVSDEGDILPLTFPYWRDLQNILTGKRWFSD